MQTGTDQAPISHTGRLLPHRLLKQRYRILKQLGQGGMGAVYKAEDTQFGNRLLAVKEMSQAGLSPQKITEATNDFKREALMLAGLMHPNLPRIYDHFSDNGRWYLVMDYIEGETMEDYLDSAGVTFAGTKSLPLEKVLDIGIQLCNVLGYLHNRQPSIIFRDLKPSNVMITIDGHIYLIDFGIARHFKPGQARDTSAFISRGYAAPEQFGIAQTSPQSDIYSLGATLHHLLTGIHPASNQPTIFDFPLLKLRGQPTPPDLTQLISQMVSKDMSKRPTSMSVVKQELQRITAQPNATAAAQPPSQGAIVCTYRQHSAAIIAIAWSPDGKRIASGGPGRVHIWETKTGSNLLTYSGHTDKVYGLTWSPDGTRIASASADKTVQVWSAFSGKNIFTYRNHSSFVSTVAWSPDGTRIASAGLGRVHVWNAATGNNFMYPGHTDKINAVKWSPTGVRIASASTDKTVQVWDAVHTPLKSNILTYRGHTHEVKAVAWSPDGKRIASGGQERIHVWDVASGNLVFTYVGHSHNVNAIAWSPEGKRIASGGHGRVHIWDAYIGKLIFAYQGHAGAVNSIIWSPDGKYITSAGDDKTVQVWQAI